MTILKWDGPFTFFDHNDGRWCFAPRDYEEKYRNAQGLYLHTLQNDDRYYVYYVGISGDRDIVSRQREHAREFLSGGYWFYNASDSIKTGKLVWRYGEQQNKAYNYQDEDNGYRRFMARDPKLRNQACEWLDALRVFFCIPEEDSQTAALKLYESGLIRHLLDNKEEKGCGVLCDNQKVSSGPPSDSPITIRNLFDSGIMVAGLEVEIHYPNV